MSLLPEISTIGKVETFSIFLIRLPETLIHKVPNVASLKSRIVVVPKIFPIPAQITIGVSHGVAVFAKNDWTVIVLPFCVSDCSLNLKQ